MCHASTLPSRVGKHAGLMNMWLKHEASGGYPGEVYWWETAGWIRSTTCCPPRGGRGRFILQIDAVVPSFICTKRFWFLELIIVYRWEYSRNPKWWEAKDDWMFWFWIVREFASRCFGIEHENLDAQKDRWLMVVWMCVSFLLDIMVGLGHAMPCHSFSLPPTCWGTGTVEADDFIPRVMPFALPFSSIPGVKVGGHGVGGIVVSLGGGIQILVYSKVAHCLISQISYKLHQLFNVGVHFVYSPDCSNWCRHIF